MEYAAYRIALHQSILRLIHFVTRGRADWWTPPVVVNSSSAALEQVHLQSMGVIKAMAAEMVECIPRGLWEKGEEKQREKTKQEQTDDGDVVMGEDDEEEVDDAMDIDQEAEDQLLQEQGIQRHREREHGQKQEKPKKKPLREQEKMLLGDALQLLWPLRVIAESPIALELHRSAAVKGLVSLGREYGVGQALAAVAVGRGV